MLILFGYDDNGYYHINTTTIRLSLFLGKLYASTALFHIEKTIKTFLFRISISVFGKVSFPRILSSPINKSGNRDRIENTDQYQYFRRCKDRERRCNKKLLEKIVNIKLINF